MTRIEIRLNREVAVPLLEFVSPVMEVLEHEAALALPVVDDDDELADVWRNGLFNTQTADCSYLMNLFDDEFRKSGTVRIEVDQADRVLRASSAVRLKIREKFLHHLLDSVLEGGDFDFAGLKDTARKGFAAYLLFSTLQEVLIRYLDG
jgi:hypothetical protein